MVVHGAMVGGYTDFPLYKDPLSPDSSLIHTQMNGYTYFFLFELTPNPD